MRCDGQDEEDNQLRIKVGDDTVLLKDHLREQKKISAPDYRPIEVVVSHLTCTVKAPPPREKQLTVGTQLNIVAKVKEKKEELDLLHDVNFYLKPGEMTLLLGAPGRHQKRLSGVRKSFQLTPIAPGCGKSTLLKLLASNLPHGEKKGTVLFNGQDPSQGNYKRSISFVPQSDTHIGTRLFFLCSLRLTLIDPLSFRPRAAQLTVKETLRFSADCQMAPWVKRADRARRVDTVLQVLGLSHRANTVVGDALLRGVSGGEKKRVTIGVEAVKDSSIFLLDEPTTGLDSSASYDVLPPCTFM